MKKLIIAAVAASLVSMPVLAAPSYGHGPDSRGRAEQSYAPNRANPGWQQVHKWQRGERFDRNWAPNYRTIGNPRAYHLQPAHKGYRWVQSGRDAVLVRLSNNAIVAVTPNAFR